jgi:hypothetical protein
MAHIFGNRQYGWQHYISSLLTASFPVSAFLFKYQRENWWYTEIVKFDLMKYQEKGLRINVLLHSDLFSQFLQILSYLHVHLDHFEKLTGAFLDSAGIKKKSENLLLQINYLLSCVPRVLIFQ